MKTHKKYKKHKKKDSKLVREIEHKVVKYLEHRDVEDKYFPASFGNTTVYGGAGGATITHWTPVPQNLTDSDRVGDKINLTRIEFEAVMFNSNGATANLYNDIRVIVFQYNSPDMSPTAAQLLITNNVLGAGSVISAYSARNLDYLKTCHALYDKTFHVEGGVPNALNYGTTGILVKHVKTMIPLKYCKKRIQFQAGGTNTNNGIWALVIGSSASVATNPTIGYRWTLHYTDA